MTKSHQGFDKSQAMKRKAMGLPAGNVPVQPGAQPMDAMPNAPHA